MKNMEELNKDLIYKQLSSASKKFYRVECEAIVDSTNRVVHDRGESQEEEGLCVVAEEQTKGRGRHGRRFYSPCGSGLYFSVLLRPELPMEQAVLLTTAAAVAGALACEECCPQLSSGEVKIKWVNDLFLRDRKFCGILTEGIPDPQGGRLKYAVLGIGFNLSPPEQGWPEELRDLAGSLYETSPPIGIKNRLVSAFLNTFLSFYRVLPKVDYLAEYRHRQWTVGKEVIVIQSDGSRRTGVALDVDDRCRLLVRLTGEEEVVTLDSGEVSVKA